ncbi:hypothetical protein CB0940_08854 [Cercospora beticola]|uniref:Uncharacterized protein n=1 Tax=Cercospora beticola TaxID=122368 RepID=A0A2G5HNV1_CERBT|nr:hypothetical protein CB0940_08854 [Cercospora beticola]PIA94225.1 hypothetical protein CB0940_08854 [Cercospora beticola]WPB05446.1 hypothetical protein RHO25_010098 [Cercospora beticola]
MSPPKFETQGHHAYCQASIDERLEFGEVLKSTPTGTRYLHIYANELQWTSLLPDGSKPVTFAGLTNLSNLRVVHIFARSFAANLKPNTVIRFDVKAANGDPNLFRLAIVYETCSSGLQIGHVGRAAGQTDSLATIARVNGSSCAGILVAAPVAIKDIPKSIVPMMEWRRYLYEIPQVPFGELESFQDLVPAAQTHLPGLLHSLFVRASKLIFEDDKTSREVAVSMLKYVVICTRNSLRHATLCFHSQRLLRPLDLARQEPGVPPFSTAAQCFEIPRLEVDAYLINAGKWTDYLTSLQNFEQLMSTTIKSNTALRDDQKKANNAMLESMSLLAKSFIDVEALRTDAQDALLQALKLQKEYQKKQEDVDSKFNVVLAGMESHKRDQKSEEDYLAEEAVFNAILKSQIRRFVDPKTIDFLAPLTGIKVSAVALKPGEKIEGAFEMLGFAHEQSKKDAKASAAREKFATASKFFIELMPYLLFDVSQVRDTFDSIRPYIDETKERLHLLQPAEASEMFGKLSGGPPLDFFSLRNRWDTFKVGFSRAFKDLREALKELSETHESSELGEINGLNDYEDEIKNMAIQGRTLLEAILKALELSTKYCRGVKEYKAREEVQQQIKKIAQDVKTNGAFDKELATRQNALHTLQQSVPDIKYAIYVRFFEALLGYTYRVGSAKLPSTIKIAADMDAAGFQKALRELQELLMDKDDLSHEEDIGEKGAAVISTKNPGAFDKDWKKILSKDGFLPFTVLPENVALKNYYRCRITDMWATFVDSHSKEKEISYQIYVGPHFLDKNSEGQLLHFYMKPYVLSKIGKENKWTEQAQRAYARPAVFCTGEVLIADTDRKLMDDVVSVSIYFRFKGVPIAWAKHN